MDIFNIINNIYTNRTNDWIKDIDSNDISPLIINKFLSMNDNISNYTRYLDKYTFNLNNKHWLYLAWAIIPKYTKVPFNKYLKKLNIEDEYIEIIQKIRKVLEMSDNDYNECKINIINEIQKDKSTWFKVCGMNKDYYKKHNVVYNMSEGEKKGNKVGLELFGF
jgi:hypothetical protein